MRHAGSHEMHSDETLIDETQCDEHAGRKHTARRQSSMKHSEMSSATRSQEQETHSDETHSHCMRHTAMRHTTSQETRRIASSARGDATYRDRDVRLWSCGLWLGCGDVGCWSDVYAVLSNTRDSTSDWPHGGRIDRSSNSRRG